MVSTRKKDDLLYWGLFGLILYMPLHYYLCELLLRGTGLDNILRDVLIIAMLALVFFTKGISFKPVSALVTISCVVLTILGVLSAALNRMFPILNVLRTYLVPMLIFYVCADVQMDEKRFSRLHKVLIGELAVIAVYGFVQAFFLGDDFLMMLGYANNGEALSSTSFYIAYFFGHQRSTGTFASPNLCGIILTIAITALLYTNPKENFARKYVLGTMLILGLLATFSRSSMLGLAVAVCAAMLLSRFWTRLSKKTFRRGATVVLTVGVALLLDQLVLKGLFLRMLLSTIFRTFTGADPSANAHKEHLLTPPEMNTALPSAWSFLKVFGLNGPMAEEYVSNPFKVESSFYLMEAELGQLGAVIYYLPYIAIIVKTILNRKRYPYFVPGAVTLAVLASYVFLPNVQNFEVSFYCFMFMGFYENPSVRRQYDAGEFFAGHVDLKELLRTCVGVGKRIPLLLLQWFPRSKDIYVFGAWLGQKFADNSRALYLYALQNTNKKCYWICNNKSVYKSLKAQGLPVLMMYSAKGLYYQLRAGVAFSCVGDGDFCRQALGGCVHVELWHGVGGGKKIGLDDREYRENALSYHCRTYAAMEAMPMRNRYFICTSKEMKKVFQSAFQIPDDNCIFAGQPRNDMFYDPDYKPETFSKEEFVGKKIIVYMPTHRKSGKQPLPMDRLLDLDVLNTFCQQNNAVFLIKKHFYHLGEKENLEQYPNIIDITHRAMDSNELLMAADYLISDYSSCTADYLLLDRPIFYYCYDYQEYLQMDRDMYWEFETITPGPRCESFDRLLASMRQAIADGEDPYKDERTRVRDMFYHPSCQCMAADKILEQTEAILNKTKA